MRTIATLSDRVGFRDQRDVDRYYGRCPDCGDVKSPRCHCDVPEQPEQRQPVDPNAAIDPNVPF